MSVFYSVQSEIDEYVDYSIYEYDDDGLILFSQLQTGPREFCDYDNKPFEVSESTNRYVVEHSIGNDTFENLMEGSIFTLDGTGLPVSIADIITIQDIYLHVTLTDGDGKDPIGIQNDGIDTMNVFATFRQTEDPLSSIITTIDNQEWRVTIKDITTNSIYDIVNIIFIEGVLNINYTTTNIPAICVILEDDFEIITISEQQYKINLVGNTKFKVFRQFV
jgi:hypothetical protein